MAGSGIFARTVRILTQSANGQSNGQVQSYDAASGDLVLRDVLAAGAGEVPAGSECDGSARRQTSFPLRVASRLAGQPEVRPSVKGPGLVREISILAGPGGNLYLQAGFRTLTCIPDSWCWWIHETRRVMTSTSIRQWLE